MADVYITTLGTEWLTEELLGGFVPVSEYERVCLLDGEIGSIDCGFRFIPTDASSYTLPSKPQRIVHGPQRKGRGGKIKKW